VNDVGRRCEGKSHSPRPWRQDHHCEPFGCLKLVYPPFTLFSCYRSADHPGWSSQAVAPLEESLKRSLKVYGIHIHQCFLPLPGKLIKYSYGFR
jgi:hypothetical protein